MGKFRLFFTICILLVSDLVAAKGIRVAVASNFQSAAQQLAKQYTRQSGNEVSISSGSTGKLYAQISNGAPYQLFLSADQLRPKLLIEKGKAIKQSLRTYAKGQLVLWTPSKNLKNTDFSQLTSDSFHFIAIANPQTAPYGEAARQTLEKLNLWSAVKSKIVMGENVSQAMHFAKSGHAQAAFVAYSMVLSLAIDPQHYEVIPTDVYSDISQDMVLLSEDPEAYAFWDFLQSKTARSVINNLGYSTP